MSKSPPRDTLSVLLSLARHMALSGPAVRFQIVAGALLELVGVALSILSPFVLKGLVDGLVAHTPHVSVLMLISLFVVSWSLPPILSSVRSVYSTKIIDRLTADLTTAALRQQCETAVTGRDGGTGELQGLIERLPYSLAILIDGLIWRAVPMALQVMGSLWLICSVIPGYFAIGLAAILIGYATATYAFARQHRHCSIETNLAVSKASRETGDLIRNAQRVVFNGTMAFELGRLGAYFCERERRNARMMWSLVRVVAWQYAIVGVGLLALLGMGAQDVGGGHMTVGAFILLQAYALRLSAPLGAVGFVFSQSALAMRTVGDVQALATERVHKGAKALQPPRSAARIQLKHVTFRYDEGRRALEDITLDIDAGGFVALVGPNGSGKSTLAKIMAGVLEPQSGDVLIAGCNLRCVARHARHGFIHYVPQYIGLFDRSLAENGCYPPAELCEADLAQRLMHWRFHEAGRAIDLDGRSGEQGGQISGGQLQKLELARIAAIRAPAIILDESTSALDTASERRVLRDLRAELGQVSTLIMISHHLEVAKAADQVVFLTNGQMIAAGPHAELMEVLPAYARFWAAP